MPGQVIPIRRHKLTLSERLDALEQWVAAGEGAFDASDDPDVRTANFRRWLRDGRRIIQQRS